MTNAQKRRQLKEARKRERADEIEQMRSTQDRVRQTRRQTAQPTGGTSGCQKRRRRKHRPQGVKLMQSKRGYLRPYYRHEFEALARGER